MKNFIKSAQSQVASHLSDDTSLTFRTEKLSRILMSAIVAVGIISAAPMTEAKAANNTPYAKIIGGSLGALAGAKVGKNKTYAERAAIIVAATTAGTWAADSLSGNNDNYQNQRQRRVEVVQSWNGQSNSYSQNRSYNQSQENNSRYGQQDSRPELISPSQMDMPPVLVDALRKSGNLGMVISHNTHQMTSDAQQKMIEVTRSLSRSGQMYSEAQVAWDEAQFVGGVEGVNAKTRAAELLNGSQKMIQSRAQDWLNIRNALAVKGVNVDNFDQAVRSELSRVQPASSYNYKMSSSYNHR